MTIEDAKIENQLSEGRLHYIHYKSIHYCSQVCLISHFFNVKTEPEVKNNLVDDRVHANGDGVREYWKIGTKVRFIPKGQDKEYFGVVDGHMYVCLLSIDCKEWDGGYVSTKRCWKV